MPKVKPEAAAQTDVKPPLNQEPESESKPEPEAPVVTAPEAGPKPEAADPEPWAKPAEPAGQAESSPVSAMPKPKRSGWDERSTQPAAAEAQGKPVNMLTPPSLHNMLNGVGISTQHAVRSNLGVPVATFNIDEGKVGLVIGKNGQSLQQLEASTGATVKFDHSTKSQGFSVCRIYGERQKAQKTAEIIQARVASGSGGPLPEGFVADEMPVEKRLVGLVLGKTGDALKAICAESGAYVHVQAPTSEAPEGSSAEPGAAEGDGGVLRIVGRRDAVDAARKLLQSKLGAGFQLQVGAVKGVPEGGEVAMREIHVEQHQMGAVIGRAQQSIRHIASETGTQISVRQDVTSAGRAAITIRGAAGAVDQGLMMVMWQADGGKGPPGAKGSTVPGSGKGSEKGAPEKGYFDPMWKGEAWKGAAAAGKGQAAKGGTDIGKAGPSNPFLPDDWFCLQCSDRQPSLNMSCTRCGFERAPDAGLGEASAERTRLLARIGDDCVPVEQQYVPYIIGPGGATLKQIKEISGAEVFVDQLAARAQGVSLVRIAAAGTPENAKARELIVRKVQECTGVPVAPSDAEQPLPDSMDGCCPVVPPKGVHVPPQGVRLQPQGLQMIAGAQMHPGMPQAQMGQVQMAPGGAQVVMVPQAWQQQQMVAWGYPMATGEQWMPAMAYGCEQWPDDGSSGQAPCATAIGVGAAPWF